MEQQRFLCELCGASYRFNKDLRKHVRDKHEDNNEYRCNVCSKLFTTLSNLRRHTREVHSNENFPCDLCNASFKSARYLKDHKSVAHVARINSPPVLPPQRDVIQEPSISPVPGPSHMIFEPTVVATPVDDDERFPQRSHSPRHNELSAFIPIERAFNSRVRTYLASHLPSGDLLTVLESVSHDIVKKLEEVLRDFSSVKFNLFAECDFGNINNEISLHNFKTKNQAVFRNDDLKGVVRKHIEKIVTESEESAMKGSGWFYLNIRSLELRINKNNPLHASRFFNLPPKFRYSKSLINIRNVDKYCFKYCILSKFITSHKDLWIEYQNRPDLEYIYDWKDIEFPVQLKHVSNFERRNNISINIFGLDDKDEIVPLKVVDVELEDHRDLLYITNGDDSHYCCIENFDSFIRPQLTKNTIQVRVCKRCFAHFSNSCEKSADDRLMEHKNLCMYFKPLRCEIPKVTHVEFNKYHHSQKVRFVIYADFECILEPISGCENNPQGSWTYRYQKHTPFSYCYLLKDAEEEYTELRLFRGSNAASHFMQSLSNDVRSIDRIINSNRKPMTPLTPEEEENFTKSSICHICKRGNFTNENYKVRDHSHITGLYRGCAHRECNLNYRDQSFIPVVVHNLSSYDSHFIVKELGFDNNRIEVIPNTCEKYISFSKFMPSRYKNDSYLKLRFIDSFRFMSSSLAELAKNLPKEKFLETKNHFKDKFELVCRKGVFPYDYVTCFDNLNEDRLPPKTAFYNKLNDENISDSDYEHASYVWNAFKIQNLGEYSDVYLKSDTLILADVFENFREMCMQAYNLDCLYYFTAPGLAWNAMLKNTEVVLSLITDMDMIMLIESAVRGGICQCVTRFSASNNNRCREYDPNMSNSYLYYVDANNLYGWAMSQYLPFGNFRWLSNEGIETLDVTCISDTSDRGYILEVDLEYPDSLHCLHSDLPFCAEMKCPPNSKVKKLITTLENKVKYVLHYRALKQALKHGLKLVKIHRAIEFDQSPWLKKYIDLNNEKRKAASNNFERDFFKLMNNAVFGKTMENIRKRIDFRLVSNAKSLEKLICKTNFVDRTIYQENLVGVHLAKTKLLFDKAIYVGMAILDISKTLMYNFHYSIMKPLYQDRIRLCYMDTDSFIYSIETENLYEDLKNVVNYLDTSVYPTDHPLFSLANKGTLGMMKDESAGMNIESFVGLRAKMYALNFGNSSIRKLKGIRKNVIRNHIQFDDYVNCLKEGGTTYTKNRLIVSNRHNVYTICVNKKTLDCRDDKRHILPDGVNTLAHGHKCLRNASSI